MLDVNKINNRQQIVISLEEAGKTIIAKVPNVSWQLQKRAFKKALVVIFCNLLINDHRQNRHARKGEAFRGAYQ